MKNTIATLSYIFEGIIGIVKDKFYKKNIEAFLRTLHKGQLLISKTDKCTLFRDRDQFTVLVTNKPVMLVVQIEPNKHKLICLVGKEKYQVAYECIGELKIITV